MKTLRTLVSTLAALLLAGVPLLAQYAPSGADAKSRTAGVFVASQYNYSSQNNYVTVGNSATGSGSITVAVASIKLNDGRIVFPYNLTSPIIVGGPTNMELVTPTGISNCYNLSTPGQGTCTITASFSNTHGFGDQVQSGSGGLSEAIYDAYLTGGGIVAIDNQWANGVVTGCTNCYTSPLNAISSIIVYPTVALYDTRAWAPQYWTAQGGTTTLAAPATLTATTVGFGLNGGNTTGGTYTGTSTYNTCIAYVDIYGQEGPCSTAFSSLTAGTGSTNQIGFSAPAASTGAVGYTIYISLASGGTTLQYKVPLATYAAGVMTSNGVCTGGLTVLEKTTAACPVANATYGQAGSAAVVSALTLNTSPVQPAVTVVSTTAIYVPNAGGRTTYAYTPGSHLGTPGLPVGFLPYTISAADATTVPSVIGTVNLPPNFMNFVGRTIEICGYGTTTASTATIENIQFQWDAIGQNTAGKGVPIADLTVTNTFATTGHLSFCAQFQTTVAGAGATAGSINTVAGFLNAAGVSLAAAAGGGNSLTGAVASLNLNSEARINVIYLHTTGTDGAAYTLQSLTARVVN